MNCPVCQVPLVLSERQGIEIDYCPKCRGVWLDRGELDKIIERSGQDFQQASSARQVYTPPPAPGYHPPQQGYHKPYKKKSLLDDLFDF